MRIDFDKKFFVGLIIISAICCLSNLQDRQKYQRQTLEACSLSYECGYFDAQLRTKSFTSRGEFIIDSLYYDNNIQNLFE